MPSPPIPRALSYSSITEIRRPPSNRSSQSAITPRTAWPKKLSNFITRSKNSSLTKQNLEEFNKRNAIVHEKRDSTSSPYYKGLTDFSLIIDKERFPVLNPERESNAAISVSSSSSSSFTRFFFKNKEEKSSSSSSSLSLPSSTLASAIARAKDREKKDTGSSMESETNNSLNKGKPLRESVSDVQPILTPQTSQLPPPPQTLPVKRVVSSSKETLPEAQSSPPLPLTAAQTLPTKRFVSSHNERVSKAQSTTPSPPPTPPMSPLPSLPPTQTSPAKMAVSSSKESESEGQSTPPTPQSPPQTSILPLLTEAQTSPDKKVELILKETNKTENEKKYFWADRYRPATLDDFICNRDKAIELKALVAAEECRHFIFEGRPGVGKRTMIWAFLREAFGAEKIQAREDCKEFQLKGEAVNSILVNVKESSKHVELKLSDLKGYEKQVIVVLIKEAHNRSSNKSLGCNRENCRAILLYEADKLSKDVLLYIRWLLERYKGCNKIFFCCNDVSKLKPIKSLCNIVQLLPPSDEEILEVLELIAKQEGIDLPRQLAEKIAKNSKNNLRQAIRSFEATWQSSTCSSPLKEDQVIMTGWEDDIAIIAKNIVEEQSPKQLYLIRGKLQNLIEHNVSPEFIFKTLVGELKKHLDEQLQIKTDKLYDDYNRDNDSDKHFAFTRNRDKNMSKKHNDPVKENVHHYMKIEEFIAKSMSCYKCSVGSNKGM